MKASSTSAPRQLLAEIARLYYLRELTHDQIAAKLGMSRVKVTRLLQKAKAEGIVEFRIADPEADAGALADALEQRFGLRRAIVTPTGHDDADTRDILGRHAAGFLTGLLAPRTVLGVGWGRTLSAMAGHLQPRQLPRLTVASLTGGMAASAEQPNPYDVASAIAGRLGARPRYLLLPAVVDTIEARDVLLRQPSAQAVLDLWQRLDICLLSIGGISTETGVFASLSDPAAAVRQAREMGAVGDLLARPFDSAGTFVPTGFADCTIGISMDLLARAPVVAGVAGGAGKARAVFGALQLRIVNTLITDCRTARAVLGLSEKAQSH